MVVLCFWELTRRDSPAEAALAVLTLLSITILLGWAAAKVWLIAKRSVRLHQNPAYMLFSDPAVLNKWGFLYVQYKATTSYFIIPTLLFSLVKGGFVAFGQKHHIVQAIGVFILELMFLVAVTVLRPYMDRTTNAFYISIASVNFFNGLLLLLLSGIFGLPVSTISNQRIQ
jgi:hypothetical protein